MPSDSYDAVSFVVPSAVRFDAAWNRPVDGLITPTLVVAEAQSREPTRASLPSVKVTRRLY
ncbi:hypothetical protein D3C86_2182920 [compost metagenome]